MCPKASPRSSSPIAPQDNAPARAGRQQRVEKISYSDALEMIAGRILAVKRDHPEDFAHRVALFMPLGNRGKRACAIMAIQMAGFPDFCSPEKPASPTPRRPFAFVLEPEFHDEHGTRCWIPKSWFYGALNLAEILPPLHALDRHGEGKGRKRHLYRPAPDGHEQLLQNLQVAPKPGTDAALALGVAHVLIEEGLFDEEYVKFSLTRLDDLRGSRQGLHARGGFADNLGPRARDRRSRQDPGQKPKHSGMAWRIGFTLHQRYADGAQHRRPSGHDQITSIGPGKRDHGRAGRQTRRRG